MPRSDLLLSLVRAGSKGDRPAFRRSLEAMVAEERGRQHHVVASQLAAYLEPDPVPAPASMRPISPTPEALVDEIHPERSLADLVLAPDARMACEQLVEEQHRGDILRSHGLEPRHRLLLVGAPGNGKTSRIEEFCRDIQRRVILAGPDAKPSQITRTALAQWRTRASVREK